MKNWLLLLTALSALSGCALLTKSAPITPRYFTPEAPAVAPAEAPAPSTAQPAPSTAQPAPSPDPTAGTSAPLTAPAGKRLRLGHIQSGPHLRERMAYRASDEELGYYDDRRWTERPEAYLRRSLSRALFEARGVSRVASGVAPTLNAELIAFEEIKGDPHKVRVQIVLSLEDGSAGYVQETITVERTLSGDEDEPGPVVHALGEALEDAVAQIADKVVALL